MLKEIFLTIIAFKQLYRSSWIEIRIITTSIIRVEYMRGWYS